QRHWITGILAGIALAAMACLFLIGHEKKFLSVAWDFESNPYSSAHVYQELSTLLQLIDKYVPNDARMWFVYQDSQGSQITVFRYAIFPRIAGGWSMGEKYSKDDVWTYTYTVDEFASHLKEAHIDYVGIGHADENFWRHYGSMFR